MIQKHKTQRGHSSDSCGMALVLCLLLMTSLCLIGGAALSVSGLNLKIVHNDLKQTQAFYIAEAGRELALAQMMEDPMWRGNESAPPPSFCENMVVQNVRGAFNVTLSDGTADGNGILDSFIPGRHVHIICVGNFLDAVQVVSCIARISPVEASAASFPQLAVISSDSITGPLTALDDMGNANPMLIQASAMLPNANASALKAMAETAFSSLDNSTWDATLGGITSFWLNSPADTRPRILYVQGDLEISGARQLYGIVLVEGKHVTLDEESGVQGVLYAPNATDVSVQNTGASGRIVVAGQIITGSGGVAVSGNQVSFQHDPDYVDAFNIAAGSKVNIEVVPGSWKMN